MRRAILHRTACLRRDTRGVSAVEFALIAPAMLLAMLGLMDLSYSVYTTTLLEGAIQKAGRKASIEGAEPAVIDKRVRRAVLQLAPQGKMTFERRAYANFSDVGRPEDFTDVNGDGACNDGEPFEDANGNGDWDADAGNEGTGGARDAILYTVTVRYPRYLAAMEMLGLDGHVTARSQTVLRNQPYGPQKQTAAVGNCG